MVGIEELSPDGGDMYGRWMGLVSHSTMMLSASVSLKAERRRIADAMKCDVLSLFCNDLYKVDGGVLQCGVCDYDPGKWVCCLAVLSFIVANVTSELKLGN